MQQNRSTYAIAQYQLGDIYQGHFYMYENQPMSNFIQDIVSNYTHDEIL